MEVNFKMEVEMEIIEKLQFTNQWFEIFLPLILITLDIITGFIYAWLNKKVSSSVMRKGLGHKAGELAYILLGFLANIAFGLHSVFLLAIFYVCFMEVISIFENCSKLGVPVPEKLKEILNKESE